MRYALVLLLMAMSWARTERASAQVMLTGRVWAPRVPGAELMTPMTAVQAFANRSGSGNQASGFRTWETEPAGWYRLTGGAGRYAIVFSGAAHFMRPVVLTNVSARDGETIERKVVPRLDYAYFDDSKWDEKAATDYYQTFVARGTSITHVGFKLATDGVDGQGPGAQDLLVSVHRRGEGPPDTWERVGPVMLVPNVDCGGVKGYVYSGGWNSGEVPTAPGETYAVHLCAKTPGHPFQTFWHVDDEKEADCYRVGKDGAKGFAGRHLWMAIGSDGDGLLIPYNKRVHSQFVTLTNARKKWAQSYVAQGRGLAAVILYAAVSGAQPGLGRQRVAVRVHRGTPEGEVVGIEKIAIGNGNYTGDASWGTFGAVFAPGEVPLEPGQTYAIEWESIETYETLHGWTNIKGAVSDDRAGFNPYAKSPGDTYERGRAYRDATEAMDFDLDAQIIEYATHAPDWADAVDATNLLINGDMQAGTVAEDDTAIPPAPKPGPTGLSPKPGGRPDAWTPFAIEPATVHQYVADGAEPDNRVLRVIGGSVTGKPCDGGYVQRVGGLDRAETYRVSGRVRSSWIVEEKHACYVGIDATGQTGDPKAATIAWTPLPDVHGVWAPYASEPIRPAKDAISVWLRGRTTLTVDVPMTAAFDAFALRRVRTDAPR